jgi:hypothetical protein
MVSAHMGEFFSQSSLLKSYPIHILRLRCCSEKPFGTKRELCQLHGAVYLAAPIQAYEKILLPKNRGVVDLAPPHTQMCNFFLQIFSLADSTHLTTQPYHQISTYLSQVRFPLLYVYSIILVASIISQQDNSLVSSIGRA